MSLAALLDAMPIPIIQAPMVGASDGKLAAAAAKAGALGTLAFGATPPDEIGPAVLFRNSRIDMLPNVSIGPAVEATRLEAGEEVGSLDVRRIAALFHRRPQLSGARIKAKTHGVAKPVAITSWPVPSGL